MAPPPPSPSPPGECVPPPLLRGRTDSPGGEGDGGGVNILEDERNRIVQNMYSVLSSDQFSHLCCDAETGKRLRLRSIDQSAQFQKRLEAIVIK